MHKQGPGRQDDVDDLRRRLDEHEDLVARLQQQVEQMQAHPHRAHKPAKIA